MKPFEQPDGTVSRAHHYFSFERDGEMLTFAIPSEVQITVALYACKALMPGWNYLDRIDSTYGQEPDQESIERWRENFLTSLATTTLSHAQFVCYVDADHLELEEKAA